MNHPRLVRTGAATVIGITIALAPVAAQAATPAAPSTSPVPAASVPASPSSPITSTAQQRSGDRVVLTVVVDRSTTVVLVDDAGEPIDALDATARQPARFVLSGRGSRTTDFSVGVLHDGTVTGAVPVAVDFAGIELAAPVDQSTEDDLLAVQHAVLDGRSDHALPVLGVPGARITFVVDGTETSAVAGPDGIAEVPVRFHAGDNDVRAWQSLNGFTSAVDRYGYSF